MIRPFLGALLLRASGGPRNSTLLDNTMTEATALIDKDLGRRTPLKTFRRGKIGGLNLQVYIYEHRKPAAWDRSGTYVDVLNELLVVAVKDDFIAVCPSEAAIRDRLARELTVGERLPRTLMDAAFVGNQAKAMWLNGIHTPTTSKPTSKALTGPALEFALDPLGDQSFYFSAVRSVLPIVQTGKSAGSIVGAVQRTARTMTRCSLT
jgi:hypothetical protein